jgi:hypothetical protein
MVHAIMQPRTTILIAILFFHIQWYHQSIGYVILLPKSIVSSQLRYRQQWRRLYSEDDHLRPYGNSVHRHSTTNARLPSSIRIVVSPCQCIFWRLNNQPKSSSFDHENEKYSNNNNNNNVELDEMRRSLEQAWNQNTMGRIPTTSEMAVLECVEAIQAAQQQPQPQEEAQLRVASSTTTPKIYLIDLLLPQYDITAGSQVYDELLIVEFAIQLVQRLLAQCNTTSSLILVKDDILLKTVTRVLNAREGNRNSSGGATSRSSVTDHDAVNATTVSTGGEIVGTISNNNDNNNYIDTEVASALRSSTTNSSNSVLISSSDNDDDIANFRKILSQSWETSTMDKWDNIRDEELLLEEEEDDDDDDDAEEEEDDHEFETKYKLYRVRRVNYDWSVCVAYCHLVLLT